MIRALQDTDMVRNGGLVDGSTRIEAVLEEVGLIAGATGPQLGENPSESKVEFFRRYEYFFCVAHRHRFVRRPDG